MPYDKSSYFAGLHGAESKSLYSILAKYGVVSSFYHASDIYNRYAAIPGNISEILHKLRYGFKVIRENNSNNVRMDGSDIRKCGIEILALFDAYPGMSQLFGLFTHRD